MRQIPLTQGKVAVVDDDIFEAVGSLKWFAHRFGSEVDASSAYAERLNSLEA